MQRLSQFDLAAVRLQGLALQVENDQARPGTVGHADAHRIASQGRPETWLNDQRDMIGVNLPAGVVRKPLMGQGALCPPAIKKADLAFFGSEIPCRRFDHAAIHVKR